MAEQLNYHFQNYFRRGISATINSISKPNSQRITLEKRIKIVGTDKVVTKTFALQGPGDVLNIDVNRIISRVEPKPNVGNFEPNYIPFIDFVEPDFLWRFSVKKEEDNWIPWLALIVLKMKDGEETGEFKDLKTDPSLPKQIELLKKDVLPDLKNSWKWAHVQVNRTSSETDSEDTIKSQIHEMLGANTAETSCRLLCPRKLKTKTKYCVFLVPAYKLGVEAGIGKVDKATTINQLAWEDKGTQGLKIPYYYKWEFRTGLRGDFEKLIRLLEPRVVPALGLRPMDCKNPGYQLDEKVVRKQEDDSAESNFTLDVEGALKSEGIAYQPWGLDSNIPEIKENEFRKNLGQLLDKNRESEENEQIQELEEGDEDPIVTPFVYGYHHRSEKEVNFTKNNWYNELNLDPRHRVAAGLGVQYIKEHQEEIMGATWEQFEEFINANRVLNRARFGREINQCTLNRLRELPIGKFINFVLPVTPRIKLKDKLTIKETLQNSNLPNVTLNFNSRRFFRERGPFRKQQLLKVTPSQDGGNILPNVFDNKGIQDGIRIVPNTFNIDGVFDINGNDAGFLMGNRAATSTGNSGNTSQPNDTGTVGIPTLPTSPSSLSDTTPAAVPPFFLVEEVMEETTPLNISDIKETLDELLSPKNTIEKFYAEKISSVRNELGDEDVDRLRPISYVPKFSTPLYQFVEEVSQDWLLPGIENVPQNTVLLLEMNSRFIESFMLGVNHEFANELRWREFPSPLNGTYFDKFWDYYNEDLKDIKNITSWNEEARLGENINKNISDNLILLIRGEVLNKYPNTYIYLVKLKIEGEDLKIEGNAIEPIFDGVMPPDITFLGFDIDQLGISKETLKNKDHNYYFVFEERVGEQRFGLDIDATATNIVENLSWEHFENKDESYIDNPIQEVMDEMVVDDLTPNWDSSSGIAFYLAQKPVRVAIHASKLISEINAND